MFDINLEDYNYNLPEELIAQYPLKDRDSSRLLVFSNGNISETIFSNIHEYLPVGSLLVFNNTRVIKARLFFTKDTGAKIEVFLLEPVNPADYSISLSSVKEVEWKCLIGNLRKWKGTTISTIITTDNKKINLSAELTGAEGDSRFVRKKLLELLIKATFCQPVCTKQNQACSLHPAGCWHRYHEYA